MYFALLLLLLLVDGYARSELGSTLSAEISGFKRQGMDRQGSRKRLLSPRSQQIHTSRAWMEQTKQTTGTGRRCVRNTLHDFPQTHITESLEVGLL